MSFQGSYLKDEDSKYCARKAITTLLKKATQPMRSCLNFKLLASSLGKSYSMALLPFHCKGTLLSSVLWIHLFCIDYMSLTASPLLFPNNFDLAGKTTYLFVIKVDTSLCMCMCVCMYLTSLLNKVYFISCASK